MSRHLQTEPSSLPRTQTFSVLGLALALRLGVLALTLADHPPGWLFTRGIEMGLLAKSLLAGLGLSSPFGTPTGPTAFIAPGYPILVAGIFRIFGVESVASAVAIMLLHIAANLVTVWLVMRISLKLFGARAAFVGGLIWACSFPLLWLPTIFWDTSLAITLLLGLVALVLEFKDRASKRLWILLGIYCAITALLNPALLFTMFGIMGWLAWQTRSASRTHPLLAVAAFAIVFSPWPIRNARVFHAFIPLRTTVGFELWMGNHEGSTGFLQESLFPMYNATELNEYIQQGELAYTQNKSHLASVYIEEHPPHFASLTARRIVRFWTGTGTEHGSALFALHATATSLLGFLGLCLVVRRRQYAVATLFAIPMLLFPAPYYITHAEFRYRLIIDPLMTILTSGALVELYRRLVEQPDETSASERIPHQAVIG
jgi:hypothetical protein